MPSPPHLHQRHISHGLLLANDRAWRGTGIWHFSNRWFWLQNSSAFKIVLEDFYQILLLPQSLSTVVRPALQCEFSLSTYSILVTSPSKYLALLILVWNLHSDDPKYQDFFIINIFSSRKKKQISDFGYAINVKQ